jgi:type VI secretion system protein ImpF
LGRPFFWMNEKYSPSFLDRLIDTHGRPGSDHHVRLASLAQIKDNVARDLEALLNTRHGQDASELEAFPHARKSILSFGIADFSSQSLANPNHRREICRSIEQAIALHEPRLRQVDVSLSVESSTMNRLYFVIKAILVVDKGREHVSFDALLQPLTLQYSITQGRQSAPEARH